MAGSRQAIEERRFDEFAAVRLARWGVSPYDEPFHLR